MQSYPELSKMIQAYLHPDFNLHSRLSVSNTFKDLDNKVYIKREDELSSGISGSKFRKYASLIPFLLKHDFDEILLIGGAFSNNISGILQLLNEFEISAKLFLLKSHQEELTGNLLWTSLLHPLNTIEWIDRKDWGNVHTMAEQYSEIAEKSNKKVFICPEGAACLEALMGAMSIVYDIYANEKMSGLVINDIILDSGTGTSAIACLLGFALSENPNRQFHICLIAGNKQEFMNQYHFFAQEVSKTLKLAEGIPIYENLKFYQPPTAKSFGSLNHTVFKAIKEVAVQEGIFMDPLYGIKSWMTLKTDIIPLLRHKNILFVNSGGSMALSGIMTPLAKYSKNEN